MAISHGPSRGNGIGARLFHARRWDQNPSFHGPQRLRNQGEAIDTKQFLVLILILLLILFLIVIFVLILISRRSCETNPIASQDQLTATVTMPPTQ